MQTITYLFSVCVLVLAVAGCRHDDPYFCEGAPHNNCLAIDAGPRRCTGDGDCTAAGAGVCDTQSMTCVQCTAAEHTACGGTSPVCGADDSCRGCSSHAECPDSNVCLPDGSCAATGDVAYVVPAPDGTDNPTCSMASPCTKLVKALATGRSYVKLHGTTDEAVTIKDRNVTVLADPGATLTRTSNGNILVIDGTSDVKIYDLAINGASGSGAGVSLLNGGTQSLTLTRVAMSGNNGTGGAILATGGTLTVSEGTISGNTGVGISASGTLTVSRSTISANNAGGVQMNADNVVTLTNNFVHHNGNDVSSSFGAFSLRPAPGSKVQFNTIIDNKANMGTASAGGVFCDVTGFVAEGNLVFAIRGATTTVQTFGNCTYGNSFVMGTAAADNTPQFVHPNTPPFDYHLTSSTPTTIRDAGGVCTGLDFDGDTRPVGAACDLGADEVRP